MAFLYKEIAPERAREMRGHLGACSSCAAQVKAWRASTRELNEWILPATRPDRRQWLPALRWATAAALILGLGVVLGRQTSPALRELSDLRASVNQLAGSWEKERAASLSNSVAVAALAANGETVRLLAQYSRLQDEQRAADQQALRVVLQNFDSRIGRLRGDLETVAVNTQDGLVQTHQDLTRLASYTVPSGTTPTRFNSQPR